MEDQYITRIGELEAQVDSLRKKLEAKENRLVVIKGFGQYYDRGFYEMLEVQSPITKEVELYQRVYYDDGK